MKTQLVAVGVGLLLALPDSATARKFISDSSRARPVTVRRNYLAELPAASENRLLPTALPRATTGKTGRNITIGVICVGIIGSALLLYGVRPK